MGLGAKIQARRKMLNATQADIAKRVSISLGYLSEIETEKKHPSLDTLQQIATALNCSVAYLLGEEPLVSSEDKRVCDLKAEAEYEIRIAIEQLHDPEKRAIVKMLDGLDRDRVRKVYDFLFDQRRLADFESGKLARG